MILRQSLTHALQTLCRVTNIHISIISFHFKSTRWIFMNESSPLKTFIYTNYRKFHFVKNLYTFAVASVAIICVTSNIQYAQAHPSSILVWLCSSLVYSQISYSLAATDFCFKNEKYRPGSIPLERRTIEHCNPQDRVVSVPID